MVSKENLDGVTADCFSRERAVTTSYAAKRSAAGDARASGTSAHCAGHKLDLKVQHSSAELRYPGPWEPCREPEGLSTGRGLGWP